MRLWLLVFLLAFSAFELFPQSADSRFEIFLRKSDNSPQTGSTVSIKNLGTMTDYALSEVVGSPGLYRRDDVPVGMYAVYVNGVLKTTNRFHPTNQIALTLAQIDPDKNYMIDTQGLETGAVTTEKIQDSTILKIDLDTSLTTWIINNAGSGGGGSGYQPDGVTIVFTLPDSTLSVANLGITTGKLAADAVTSAKIQDGSITTADIANGTISTVDLGFTVDGAGLSIDELNNLNAQGDGETIGIIGDGITLLANSVDSSKVINRSLDTLDFKWGHIVLSPGDGLGGAEKLKFGVSNTIYVNPDNTGITISGDAVALKDGGVYPEKVNALVAGLGLGKPNAESGIQINAGDGLFIENDTLKVNASGVINAGLGLSQDGNDFNVNTKEGIVISADTVQLNPSIGGIGLSYDAGVLNVKAGHGVQISSDTVRINPAVAGKGLKWKGDSLDIVVTDKSLVISSDTLKVNSAIAGGGLGYAAELMAVNVNRGLSIVADSVGINVDDETIEISNGELQQKRDRALNLLASWCVWDRPVERNYVELETDDAMLDTVYFAIPYVQIGDSVRIDSVHFYMAGDGSSSLDIFKLMTNSNGSDAVAYTSTTEKSLTSGNVTIKYNSIAKSVAMPLTLFVRADLAASANVKFYSIRIYHRL